MANLGKIGLAAGMEEVSAPVDRVSHIKAFVTDVGITFQVILYCILHKCFNI
jgi:hypothetical protein